jgi:hypothetical protein
VLDLIFGRVGPRLRPLMSVGNPPLQRTRSRIIWVYAPAIGSIRVRHNDSSYRPNVQSGLERWVERT